MIVYADESGIHDPNGRQGGSEWLTVAGYVSDKSQYEKLTARWQRVLSNNGIRVFHMREFVDKRNSACDPNWPYYGWSEEKRHQFLETLQILAQGWTLFGVAARVDVPAYNRIFPVEGRSWLKHPYFLALLCFYGAVLEEMRSRFIQPKEKLNFIFDYSTEFNKYGVAFFEAVKQESDNSKWMEGIAFHTDDEHVPLQSADLLAYRSRQIQLCESPTGPRIIKSTRLDRDLGLGTHVLFTLDDEASMRSKISIVEKLAIKWEFPKEGQV